MKKIIFLLISALVLEGCAETPLSSSSSAINANEYIAENKKSGMYIDQPFDLVKINEKQYKYVSEFMNMHATYSLIFDLEKWDLQRSPGGRNMLKYKEENIDCIILLDPFVPMGFEEDISTEMWHSRGGELTSYATTGEKNTLCTDLTSKIAKTLKVEK